MPDGTLDDRASSELARIRRARPELDLVLTHVDDRLDAGGLGGLRLGDQVILSDMSASDAHNRIRLE